MKHLTATNMYRKTIKTAVTGPYCTCFRDDAFSLVVFIHRTLSKQEGFSSAAQEVFGQKIQQKSEILCKSLSMLSMMKVLKRF